MTSDSPLVDLHYRPPLRLVTVRHGCSDGQAPMPVTWARKRAINKTIADAVESGLMPRDQRLLAQLLGTGAKLGSARNVSYYLYLPTNSAAQLAADDIRHAQFLTELRPPLSEYPDQWPLIASLDDCQLTIAVIRANSSFFSSIATRYGGDYEGWQATS